MTLTQLARTIVAQARLDVAMNAGRDFSSDCVEKMIAAYIRDERLDASTLPRDSWILANPMSVTSDVGFLTLWRGTTWIAFSAKELDEMRRILDAECLTESAAERLIDV